MTKFKSIIDTVVCTVVILLKAGMVVGVGLRWIRLHWGLCTPSLP